MTNWQELKPARPRAERRPAARGYSARQGARRLVIQFDDETFEQIGERAQKERVTVTEMVRLLVEWGLEA